MDQVWTDEIDDAVQRTRFSRGDGDWWDSSRAVVEGLSPAERDHLARIGLVELVRWSHRIERDATEPCFGETAVRQRWPDLLPALEDEDSAG